MNSYTHRPQVKRGPLGSAVPSYVRLLSMRTNLALALFAIGAFTAVACSDSSSSPSAPSAADLCANSGAAVTVNVTEYAFTPSSITVIDGQSVCWANTGTMTHTVVENVAGRFGGNLPPGQTLVHTFAGSENYGYHCGIHSTMTGTITGTCKPGEISC